LNNQTANYIVCLANQGLAALQNNQALLNGLNIYRGQVMHPAVAKAFNLPYISPQKALVA
jgi:alanine dehydrogenase